VNLNGGFWKILSGVTTTLLALGIVAGIVTWGRVNVIESNQPGIERRLDSIEAKMAAFAIAASGIDSNARRVSALEGLLANAAASDGINKERFAKIEVRLEGIAEVVRRIERRLERPAGAGDWESRRDAPARRAPRRDPGPLMDGEATDATPYAGPGATDGVRR